MSKHKDVCLKDFITESSNFKIAVFYENINWARIVFDRLYKELNNRGCVICKKGMFIKLISGTEYYFLPLTSFPSNTRGYSFDRIYYENDIEADAIETYSVPLLRPRQNTICRIQDTNNRYANVDTLIEKSWSMETRDGTIRVVDVEDIINAPTIEIKGDNRYELV